MSKNMIKTVRSQLFLIELFMCIGWLIPVAIEVTLLRFVPQLAQRQTEMLIGAYACNRILLAPLHMGRYAVGQVLFARTKAATDDTCEIRDLHSAKADKTLLKVFFTAFRTPIACLKKQLMWDAVRACLYAPFVFLCFCVVAFASRIPNAEQQLLLVAYAVMLSLIGMLLSWVVLRRLQTALYSGVGWIAGWKQTRKITSLVVWEHWRAVPHLLLPCSPYRTMLQVRILRMLKKQPQKLKKQKYSQIFHTRVLEET